MTVNFQRELALLERMSVKELKTKYAEVFGDETRTGNRVWLVRRIAWRIQANTMGGLSERALKRATELSNESDLRTMPPKLRGDMVKDSVGPPTTVTQAVVFSEDNRVPLPGTVLSRQYKGRTIHVRVLQKGFEFEGEVYRSLSAVAKAISGTHCNGFRFFQLEKDPRS
jgi:hypothetical protein